MRGPGTQSAPWQHPSNHSTSSLLRSPSPNTGRTGEDHSAVSRSPPLRACPLRRKPRLSSTRSGASNPLHACVRVSFRRRFRFPADASAFVTQHHTPASDEEQERSSRDDMLRVARGERARLFTDPVGFAAPALPGGALDDRPPTARSGSSPPSARQARGTRVSSRACRLPGEARRASAVGSHPR
jgi:hypothetical protein